MHHLEKINEGDKGFNIFLLVVVSSIIFLIINVLFYHLQADIDYFEVLANSILLLTTFYLIYITQRNSTNKSGFYYYTSIGFTFLFFGLFILTLNQMFIYDETIFKIATRLLFVFGYSLLAIGVTKWVKYNELRHDELSLQANTDELTGILNRRSFTAFLKFEFDKSNENSAPFSLIILDIDFFKLVNDNNGHLYGDEVLKNLAFLMNKSFRSGDKICRWGGEEFAILLPDTSFENAMTVAEKIRELVANQPFTYENTIVNYTISLGVSEFLISDTDIESVISRADEALYIAKNNNRNCVRSVRA